MKISVITVCKNPGEGIKKTVESVISQTYADIEYIIVDGASTDGTVEYLESINSPDPSINSGPPSLSKREGQGVSLKFLSESDSGIYNAMNKGINLATGEYLLFLNAGDYFFQNDVISEVTEMIEKDGRKNEIYFGNIITEDQKTGKKYEVPERLKKVSALRLFFWSIPHPAAFIKKDLLKKVGGYDESFKISGDYDFFVKVFYLERSSFKHIPLTISVFQTGGISSDEKNKEIINNENSGIIRKYYGLTARLIHDCKPLLVISRVFYKIYSS